MLFIGLQSQFDVQGNHFFISKSWMRLKLELSPIVGWLMFCVQEELKSFLYLIGKEYILRYISFYTESTEIQMYHEMLFYNFLMNYQSFTFMKFGSMLHCVTQFLHLMLIFQKTLLLNYDWKLSLHWL